MEISSRPRGLRGAIELADRHYMADLHKKVYESATALLIAPRKHHKRKPLKQHWGSLEVPALPKFHPARGALLCVANRCMPDHAT